MISRVSTAVYSGIEGHVVTVETDIAAGLPATNIVGLASAMIMEARDRVKAAVLNSGFDYPMRRITINLTPGALRKTGTHLDLPIAIGILATARMIKYAPSDSHRVAFIGELTLDGGVYSVEGILPMVKCLHDNGFKSVVLPKVNLREASLIDGIELIGVESLSDCIDYLRGKYQWDDTRSELTYEPEEYLDFADIKGQESAKRAITISAAGEHGLIMVGNPGCGKTMLSKRIPSILPRMSREEIIETTMVYSVVGQIDDRNGAITNRPFRMPHHSTRRAGLIGGGLYPVPGEISLAHNGVLFLDEATEFDRAAIESLRLPLEDNQVSLFRQGHKYTFPSRFLLVMAANPCKCGYFGDPDKECKCSQADIESYKRKFSGPLLERIDMQIVMDKVSYGQISSDDATPYTSSMMREEVERARAFAKRSGRSSTNSKLTDEEIKECVGLKSEEQRFMEQAYSKCALSPRTYMKMLRVARTIADMAESDRVTVEHLSEVLMYRTAIEKIHA